jgi:hypothetical protein
MDRMNMDLQKFLKFGITEEQLSNFQIIILPENYSNTTEQEELSEAINTLDLFKELKKHDINCATIEDFGISPVILDRWSSDKWFGTVYLRDKVALPILTNAIAALIVFQVTTQNPEGKVITKPDIHIELKIQEDSTITSINYDGDGETFLKILESLENGK